MRALGWISTKLYIGFKRIFTRPKPVCASKILRKPQGVLIVLQTRDENSGASINWVKRWKRRKILMVSGSTYSIGGVRGAIYCGKVVPFSKEFYRLRDSLASHSINLLIDLNEKPQDRSRMISVLSKAELRVASFSDPPFFNCQIKVGKGSPNGGAELLRILERYLWRQTSK